MLQVFAEVINNCKFKTIVLLIITVAGIGCSSSSDKNKGSQVTKRQNSQHGQSNSTELSIEKDTTGQYHFKFAKIRMSANPLLGGRITSLKVHEREMLAKIDSISWGITLWPSPQKDWGWPPPSKLDRQPYAANLKNNKLTMLSKRDSSSGLQFEKILSLSTADTAIHLRFLIYNISNQNKKVAPWLITRMHKESLVFFPVGPKNNPVSDFKKIPHTTQNGIIWYPINRQDTLMGEKVITDGSEGWIGTIYKNRLLVHSFEDIPPENQAPGEGDVEIWNDTRPFIEVEPQGAYQTLEPGEKMAWEVKIFLRKIPAHWNKIANKEVVNYIRKELMKGKIFSKNPSI